MTTADRIAFVKAAAAKPLPELIASAKRLAEDMGRRAYAEARIAELTAEPFPDCDGCGNPCDFDKTQCPPCLEADARAAWADDEGSES